MGKYRYGFLEKREYNPLCNKCGEHHYNFQPCTDEALERKALSEAAEREATRLARNAERFGAATIVRRPRKDGLTVWQGDKLDTFSERQGNSLRLARPEPAKPRLAKAKPTLVYPEA